MRSPVLEITRLFGPHFWGWRDFHWEPRETAWLLHPPLGIGVESLTSTLGR